MTRGQKADALATLAVVNDVLREQGDVLALDPEQRKALDHLTVARAEIIIALAIMATAD